MLKISTIAMWLAMNAAAALADSAPARAEGEAAASGQTPASTPAASMPDASLPAASRPAPKPAASAQGPAPSDQTGWFDSLSAQAQQLEEKYGTRLGLGSAYTEQAPLAGEHQGAARGGWSYWLGIEQRLWPGATLSAGAEGGAGKGLERIFPTYSGLNDSAAEPEAIYLADLHIFQKLDEDRLALAGGIMNLTQWFDKNAVANNSSTQFLSSSLVNNPTIPFPYAMPGIMVQRALTDWASFQTGVAFNDALAHQFFPLHYQYLREDFVVNVNELDLTAKLNEREGHYRLLYWLDHRCETILDGDRRTSQGFAASVDQSVAEHVTLFARYGLSQRQVPPVEQFWSFGGELAQPLPDRTEDALGAAVAQSILRHAVHGAAETLYELYYRFAITHALYLTPDLQFISNPAGDSNADFTVVLGLRLSLSF